MENKSVIIQKDAFESMNLGTKLATLGSQGGLDRIQELLNDWKSSHDSVNDPNDSDGGPSPFHWALKNALTHGRSDVALCLLDQGVRYDHTVIEAMITSDSDGRIFRSDKETDRSLEVMLQLLLDHGWDINAQSSEQFPALWFVLDNEPLRTWFFAHGADPNIKNFLGDTPLDFAIRYLSLSEVTALVQHGAKSWCSNALQTCATFNLPQSIDKAVVMLEQGADINGVSFDSRRGLDAEAYRQGHITSVHELDVETISEHWKMVPLSFKEDKTSALHNAVLCSNKEMIKFLLKRGADPDLRIRAGDATPRELAERFQSNGFPDIIQPFHPSVNL